MSRLSFLPVFIKISFSSLTHLFLQLQVPTVECVDGGQQSALSKILTWMEGVQIQTLAVMSVTLGVLGLVIDPAEA